jgi:hypothetical protein
MSIVKQIGPTRREVLVDQFATKMRRTASYWSMAVIGLSAAASLLRVGILVLVIRALWKAF